MKKLVFLCLPIIAMIICGCPDENAPQPTPKQSVIIPLTLGNKWTYQRESWYKNEKDSTITELTTYTISLDSVRDIGGKKIFTEMGSIIGGKTQVWGYVFYDSQGYWLCDQQAKYVELTAKHPGEVGYKWGEKTATITDQTGQKLGQFFLYAYIVSTGTTIKINNKDYNCYHYRLQLCDITTKEPIVNSYIDSYYAENIGLVMMKQLHNGNEVTRTELLDYTVK